jgi:predicted porin
VTQLRYTEESGLNNKFSEYKTTTFTTTAEYKLDANWTVAAGYQMGAAGTCSLSGGADCSTDGLGGSAVNVGARYDFDRSVGIFALAGVINNNSNSAFGTGANTGGKVSNVAVGIHFRY